MGPLVELCLLVPLVKGKKPVLRSKWDLPRPDLFFCDSSEYVFRFDLSTIIEDYQIKTYLLRGENCDIDIGGNEVSNTRNQCD